MKLLVITLICLLVVSASAERKRYDGYHALAVTPTTQQQLEALRTFMDHREVDFWQEPRRLNAQIHFMASPQVLPVVKLALDLVELPYTVHRENVQEHLDEEWARLDKRFQIPDQYVFNIDDYNTYGDIMSWLEEKKNACRSGFTCTTENIGTSTEGRNLTVFKMTGSGDNRRVVWSDSLIHAREWLAGATNLKILNHVLTSTSADVANLTGEFDFWFLPVMNPDGYVYSWTSERFWRKSRNPNEGSDCFGTDLNRNYDHYWMSDGTSGDPCSDLYGGSGPGSEPETQAVQTYVKQNGANNKMIAFISIHTAAQMWLHPYGHTDEDGITCARTPDHDDQTAVANAAADATENTGGGVWTRGSICETIYPASGTTADFAYGNGTVKYSFTPELRGPGFDPGNEEIQPSFEEIWSAYVALIAEAKRIG